MPGALRVAFAVALATAAWAIPRAAAALPARVDVSAAGVALYPFTAGTTLLEARGHVIVRAASRTLWADQVRYDLMTNRLIAAGHVRLASGTAPPVDAAACALDLARDTTVYERLDPLPATFHFRGSDATTALEAPVDAGAFALADLGDAGYFVRGRRARIVPGANVRFTPAIFPTGAFPPVQAPTYLYSFARTNFSQSSLPGASFDQPYPLFGTADSLTTGHLRYDPVNDASIALDERLVQGNTAYASGSWIPLRGQRFDLDAFAQLRRGITQTFAGYYLYGPLHESYGAYSLQWTSPSSRTIFNASQLDSSNHASLTLSSIDHFVRPLATYRLQVTYGYDHEPGTLPFDNVFSITTAGYAASPSLHLPLGLTSSLRYDFSIQDYDFPHQVASDTWTLSLSRAANRDLSFYGTAAIEEYADRYRDDAAKYLDLPDPFEPYFAPDGTPFPGIFAFAGINTLRSYFLQSTWRPHGGENSLQLFLTATRDFPQFHGYGRPPLYATLDVTQRLGSTLRVDLARSYGFGWNRQYLTQWSLGISP